MNTDNELLRRYVEARSEAAFTELVQRHIGLVYSVALRRVGGDAHLAEDVAQKVFCDLARKAPSLTDRATVSGWLYAGAHMASAAVVRSEQRRKNRETQAVVMQNDSSSETNTDWAQLRPVIDDAFMTLKEEEREAVALRFFQQRSFAEIGRALRVTEEAARKRVDRALEKLRAALGRQGVTSTATALGIALTAVGSTPAPAHLGAQVASHAVATAHVATAGAGASAAFGLIWPAAAVLMLGTLVIGTQQQANRSLRAELAQLSAEAESMPALRAENQRLARAIADAEALRQAAARPPMAAAIATGKLPARPISTTIVLSPQGTIAWNGEGVTLKDFVARLRAEYASADPESRVHVQATGANHAALCYIIDEARKAGINHLTVDCDAKPDPRLAFWF